MRLCLVIDNFFMGAVSFFSFRRLRLRSQGGVFLLTSLIVVEVVMVVVFLQIKKIQEKAAHAGVGFDAILVKSIRLGVFWFIV
ncbi:hypothetical protein CCP2SC5_240019 [Azospirillaceae bacterium]